MKAASMDIQIDCDCGHLMSMVQPVVIKALTELRYKCKGCTAGFVIHIQEVKNPNWSLQREVHEL